MLPNPKFSNLDDWVASFTVTAALRGPTLMSAAWSTSKASKPQLTYTRRLRLWFDMPAKKLATLRRKKRTRKER